MITPHEATQIWVEASSAHFAALPGQSKNGAAIAVLQRRLSDKVIEANRALVTALKTVLPLVEHLQTHPEDTLDAHQQQTLDQARALFAKTGAA